MDHINSLLEPSASKRPRGMLSLVAICACVVISIASALLANFLVEDVKPESQNNDGVIVVPAVGDFGTVDTGIILEKIFSITNGSDHSIQIIGTSKSCDCTEAEVSPRVIPPEGTAHLKVSWDITDKQEKAGSRVLIFYKSRNKNNKKSQSLTVPLRVKIHSP